MARSHLALAALLPLIALAEERPPADPLAGATPAPKPQATPSQQQQQPHPGRPNAQPGASFRRPFPGGLVDPEKARETLRNMNPEERQAWLRRFREFANMPPEKRRELMDRQEMFRRKMREDVDAAITASGLTLTDEQRRRFTERYAEERRKIEEELRQKMEELRKPKVEALVEKLKTEFSEKP